MNEKVVKSNLNNKFFYFFLQFYSKVYYPVMDILIFPLTSFLNKVFLFFFRITATLWFYVDILIELMFFLIKKTYIFSFYYAYRNLLIRFFIIFDDIILYIANFKVRLYNFYYESINEDKVLKASLEKDTDGVDYDNIYSDNINFISKNDILFSFEKAFLRNISYIEESFLKKTFLSFVLSKFSRINLILFITRFIIFIFYVLFFLLFIPLYFLYSCILYIYNFLLFYFLNIYFTINDSFKIIFNINKISKIDSIKLVNFNNNLFFYCLYFLYHKFIINFFKYINLFNLIKRFKSYVLNSEGLTSWFKLGYTVDEVYGGINRFNMFLSLDKKSKNYFQYNFKQKEENYIEDQFTPDMKVRDRILNSLSPAFYTNLLSEDDIDYNYSVSETEVENPAYSKIYMIRDFLYKSIIFNNFFNNVLFIPFLSFIIFIIKVPFMVIDEIDQSLQRQEDWAKLVDARIHMTTRNPLMRMYSDNVTVLIYNAAYVIRIKGIYLAVLFGVMSYKRLFCYDGLIYVANTYLAITFSHSPVILGVFIFIMVIRWENFPVVADDLFINHDYLFVDIDNSDEIVDDEYYLYSIIPTIILATYYSTYIKIFTLNVNFLHFSTTDTITKFKKVWRNHSTKVVDFSSEPLNEASSDFINNIINYLYTFCKFIIKIVIYN